MDDVLEIGQRLESIEVPGSGDCASDATAEAAGMRTAPAEQILSSPMVTETRADAELFVQYAAGAGIEVPDDIRRAVFAASPLRAMGDPELVATNLLGATTKLARGLYPVTAASLRSTNDDADRTVGTLRRAAIVLAAIILPISVSSFVTSAISEAIRQDIDAATSIALKLRAELPPQQDAQIGGAKSQLVLAPGASEFDVFMQLQQFAETIRAIDGRALQLRWFVPFMVSDPWQAFRSDADKMRGLLQLDPALADPAKIAREKIRIFQEARFYGESLREAVSVVYGAITSCILPVLYSILGACAYLLMKTAEDIKKRRFVKSHADMARFVIAGIGGGVVGLFNFAIAQPVSVSPLALAFLVGYAVDVFFTLLQTLVMNFTRRLTAAEAPAAVSAHPPGTLSSAPISTPTASQVLGPQIGPAGLETRVRSAVASAAQDQPRPISRQAA